MSHLDDRRLERLEQGLVSGRISRRGFIASAIAAGLVATRARALADELSASANI